jgi:type I restriction enzyme S subunit
MYTVKIKSDVLEHRLDSSFYNPIGLAATKKLNSIQVSKISEMVDQRRKITNGVRGPEWAASKFKLIRLQDCENWIVNSDGAASISKNQFEENRRCKLMVNDIVVAIGGYIGNAAVVVDQCDAVIGQHSAVLPEPERAGVDSRFLVAFLNSKSAEAIFSRYVSGTVQAGVNLEDLRDLPAPRPDNFVQKYIGDKVRQAERLRARAKELRSSVDMVLGQLNLPTSEVPQTVNRVSIERLEARLDPRPYRTHYINLVDRIKAIKHSCVSDVAELASGCPVSSSDFVEGGEVPLVRIRNIGFDEFIDLDTGVTKELHKDEAKYQAKENMIVLGMDGIFRAQFFLSDELPMLVNQRVAMLTANNIRAELLTHWLNRPEGQMQLNQWAVKTTVEHTSLSDIGRVRVPRLDTEIEDSLADKLLSARRAYRYSRFLTICAKQLVEALIEGQLIEAELIAAEQALQAGNDLLDRRILGRLKISGIDGQGAALFEDLDELYRLLRQAEVD